MNYARFRRSLERTRACKFIITRTEFQVSTRSTPSITQEAFDDNLTSVDSIQTFKDLNNGSYIQKSVVRMLNYR